MKTYIILLSRRTKPSLTGSHHSSHNATFWPPCRKLTIFFPSKQNLNRKRNPPLLSKVERNLHPKNVTYPRLWLTHQPIYLGHLSVVKRIAFLNLHPRSVPYPRLWLTLQPVYLVHPRVKRIAFLTKIASRRSTRKAANSLILEILGDLVIVSPITRHSGLSLLYVSIGRKTEEGWSVYKEAELGLNSKGGGKWLSFRTFLFFMPNFKLDTPSCPFDCNCCKSLFSCVIILLLKHYFKGF